MVFKWIEEKVRPYMMEPQDKARSQTKRGSNNMPSGMRLSIMATKGKMSANPSQLFESDNESVYDSDGEYESV